VHDGLVVFIGNACGGDNGLVALDTASGQESWRLTLPAGGLPTSPDQAAPSTAAAEDVVVVPLENGIVALDVGSGAVVWSEASEPFLATAPDIVLAASAPNSRTMVALDRRTGHERWRAEVETELTQAYGVAADATSVLLTIYQQGQPDKTVAYDAASGARRWEARFGQASDTSAVRIIDGVASGVDASGSNPNDIRAFDVVTGRPLWTLAAYPVQSPEPVDGNIFVGRQDGTVAALDPRSGHVRWALPTMNGSLSAGPGLILAPDGDHAVQALDPTSGRPRWSIPLDAPQLPEEGAVNASGFSVYSTAALPTSDGVFITYGNCLGS
jgi:outer membrane protein assembly factor BamB